MEYMNNKKEETTHSFHTFAYMTSE